MQIEFVSIKQFRNLTDFKITLDTKYPKTVLVGQNASGKSNFLEAIVLIFKFLDFDFKKPLHDELTLGFAIKYRCYNNSIHIEYLPKGRKKWSLIVNKKSIDQEFFIENKDQFLPRYILAYYSGLGNSNRLEEHFEDHKEKFAKAVLRSTNLNLPEYPRMQYAELIHSQFSLFSFFIENDPELKKFLKEYLFVEDIQSTLLTIRQPDWSRSSDRNEKFWGSHGVVRALLDYLYDNVAIAPLRHTVDSKSALWKKEKKKVETLYLYFSDFRKIADFVKKNKWSSFDFFHILNTANVSRLILNDGIKIRVKKKFASKISFRDLSEGEQQLLTVLGLMRFTSGEETLFLLDEPDTHLNPYWRWKYLDFIDEIVFKKGKSQTKKDNTADSHVIMTSHDAITIGSLNRDAVRIFETNSQTGVIETSIPNEDPKGMGVAGILTEIFHLRTTLDEKTFDQLERRRQLESMKYNGIELTDAQSVELKELNDTLDLLGFSRVTRDPLYQKFQARYDAAMEYKRSTRQPLSKEQVEQQKQVIDDILKKMIEEEAKL